MRVRYCAVLLALPVWAVACSGDDDAVNTTDGGGANHAGTSSGGDESSGGSVSPGAGTHAGGTAQAGTNASGGSNAGQPGGGNSNGGSATGGSANEGGAPGAGGSDSGCSPTDDFDGSALSSCWSVLNGTPQAPLISVAVTAGALHLRAQGNQNGVWYQGSTKSLVYQLVSAASFKVTTTAHPRKATAAGSLPTKDLHVGGLMVRDPASQGGNSERYVLFMTGHSENNNGVVHQGVEFKSTVNGCSDWNEPDWGPSAMGADAELRICRLHAEFRLYKRVPGDATWTPAAPPSGCAGNAVVGDVLTRADLPSTVQVGLGLNFSAPSDLDVAFDSIELVPLASDATVADCTAD